MLQAATLSDLDSAARRLSIGFLNWAHALDHFVMLIFPTVVISLLLIEGRGYADLIALGIHAGTAYYDCSEHFVGHLNALLSGYCNGRTVLAAPFLSWSKHSVYDFCAKNEIPIHLTWSCEIGPVTPCGRCLSCEDRGQLSVCTAK